MTQPKLRVGDTFVYTEEMNNMLKTLGESCPKEIGKTLKILMIEEGGRHLVQSEAGNIYLPLMVMDAYKPSSPRTLDDVKEGDVLVITEGHKRIVLGRCGSVVFLSNDGACTTWTILALKNLGYKLADQPEERWKPENNEAYWFVGTDGKTDKDFFSIGLGKNRFELGNCFKTKAEAQQAAEELKEFWRGRINNQK